VADLGCTVHAYDAKVHLGALTFVHDNVRLHREMVAPKALPKRIPDRNTTLRKALQANGDLKATITYLKMDVEGMELLLLPEWLRKGLLKNVRQLAVEFHSVQRRRNVSRYARIVKELHRRGFKLMSWQPNLTSFNK